MKYNLTVAIILLSLLKHMSKLYWHCKATKTFNFEFQEYGSAYYVITRNNIHAFPSCFQDDNADEERQCFEYCDEVEETSEGGDCTELRVLLLFLFLWQSVFKVADRAILVLLKFFKLFLHAVGRMLKAEVLINFAKIIPETLYLIEKNIGLQKDSFTKYAVCPKCKTLYNFEDCIRRRPNGEAVSAKCSHVELPRHPQQARRRPCGTVLMKTMRSRTGKPFLYPKQVYCFRKLTDSLQDLINKPDFMELTVKGGEAVPLSYQRMFLETALKGEYGKSFSMWMVNPFLLYQITLVSC